MLAALILAQACACSDGNFPGLTTFTAQHPYGSATGLYGSAEIVGLALGGRVFPGSAGNALVLQSRQNSDDPGSGVVIEAEKFRSAGSYLAVNTGFPCSAPVVRVSSDSNLVMSTPLKMVDGVCQSDNDYHHASFVDSHTSSGHVALWRPGGYYTIVEDSIGEREAVLPDGGQPRACDYPAGWVVTKPDGGTHFESASRHGGFTVQPTKGRNAGFLFGVQNPRTGGIHDQVFKVDVNGGIVQRHGLARWQFPPCPETLVMSSDGQFFYGAVVSTLLYAEDDMHWHACAAGGWRMLRFAEDD